MKLCHTHMTALAAALRKKGLGRYIHDDPAESKRCAEAWLKGTAIPDNPHDFDPLAISVLELYQKATTLNLPVDRYLGGEVVHRCPLCALPALSGLRVAPEQWVDNLTDRLVVHARLHDIRVGT